VHLLIFLKILQLTTVEINFHMGIWPGTHRLSSSSITFLTDSVFGFFEFMSPSIVMSVLTEFVMITRRSTVRLVTYIDLMIASFSAM
jgi:hypothetical protein